MKINVTKDKKYLKVNFGGDTYSFHKDYYTVVSGKVYLLREGLKESTGDSLLDLKTSSKEVGKYNPRKKYKSIVKDFTYKEINKFLKSNLSPQLKTIK